MKPTFSSVLVALLALFPLGAFASGHTARPSRGQALTPASRRPPPAPRASRAPVLLPRVHVALPVVHLHPPMVYVHPPFVPVQKRWVQGHYELVWVEGRCEISDAQEQICYAGRYENVWMPGYYELVAVR